MSHYLATVRRKTAGGRRPLVAWAVATTTPLSPQHRAIAAHHVTPIPHRAAHHVIAPGSPPLAAPLEKAAAAAAAVAAAAAAAETGQSPRHFQPGTSWLPSWLQCSLPCWRQVGGRLFVVRLCRTCLSFWEFCLAEGGTRSSVESALRDQGAVILIRQVRECLGRNDRGAPVIIGLLEIIRGSSLAQ